MRNDIRHLKPETITRALLALRADLIREGGPGLEHVEALLVLRGSNLPPVPRKAPPQNFRRGKLRLAIFAALRNGPLPGPELVRRVAAAHGLDYEKVYRSAYTQLGHMRRAGLMTHEDGLLACPY
jgi:hypothetical protein